jgi:hypothetical protein
LNYLIENNSIIKILDLENNKYVISIIVDTKLAKNIFMKKYKLKYLSIEIASAVNFLFNNLYEFL